MINATEARILVEHSEAELNKRLQTINIKIEQAAKLGKREIWLDMELPGYTEFKVLERPFNEPELTPVQRLVKDGLSAIGFTMKIATRETRIGGGLGSMDDEIEIKHLPYIKIGW